MRNGILWGFLSAAILLAGGCADSAPGRHHGDNAETRSAAARIFYSPNGEPLTGGALGMAPCGEVMARWFDRVDTNHDGALGHDEFLADARIQFDRMDRDHDGFITADELTAFRAPFTNATPQSQSRPQQAEGESGAPQEGGGGRHHHHQGGGKNAQASGAQRSPVGTGADPVMSADTNLDFKVSWGEFQRQAEDWFAALDLHHVGAVAKDDLHAACPSTDPDSHHHRG